MKQFISLTLAFLVVAMSSCKSDAQYFESVENLVIEKNIPGIQVLSDNVGFYMGEGITDTTVFQAASLSKVVFSYIVLRLVDQGVLDLDTPLMSYYDNHRFRTEENFALAQKLTARLVMSHRTGLPNWAASPSSAEWPQSEIKFICPPEEKGDTAVMFTYSGEGFAYLQHVVEHLTGLSINELASREVFEPLGMANSWYGWREDFEWKVTQGHRSDGTPVGIMRYPRANTGYTLMTCSIDYYRFLQALVKGKGLKPETFKEMITPQYEKGKSHRIYENLPISWGLGVGLTDDGALWHWGDNGTFKSFFAAYPKEILVYFTNSYNGLKILPEMLELFFNTPAAAKGKEPQVLLIPEWIDCHEK